MVAVGRNADGVPDLYVVFCDRPGDLARYALEVHEVGSVRRRVIAADDDRAKLASYIPDGHAPTGVPDGPHMTEVWVHRSVSGHG